MDFRVEERLFNTADDGSGVMINGVHIKAPQQLEDAEYAC